MHLTHSPTYPLVCVQGDAEDLPFATDSFDRYVSAGSIEYWPEPQRGIKEAYRVIKEGGIACLIGPVHPTFWLSRIFADVSWLGRTACRWDPGLRGVGMSTQRLRGTYRQTRGDCRSGLMIGERRSWAAPGMAP